MSPITSLIQLTTKIKIEITPVWRYIIFITNLNRTKLQD